MSRKGDEQYIGVLGKDGVIRLEPAYWHFPVKWEPHNRSQRWKQKLWALFGRDYYEFPDECVSSKNSGGEKK